MVAEDGDIPQMIALLKLGGLWLNYNNYKYKNLIIFFQKFRLFFIIIVWILLLIIIFTKGMTYLLSEAAVFIPIGFTVITSGSLTTVKFKNTEATLNYIKFMITKHEEKWALDIIKKELEDGSKYRIAFKKFLYVFATTYIFGPIIFDIIRASLGYEHPYKVPLPLDGYFDEIIVRNFKYHFLTFLSNVWFVLIVLNNLAFQGLFFYLASYGIGEMKVIKKKCELMGEPLYGFGEWDLSDIVDNHQRLLRLMSLQKELIGAQLSAQNFVSTVAICLLMYMINNTYESDQILCMLCSNFIVFILILMGVYCNKGETIQSLSIEIFQSFCDMPWYNQRPKVRKIMNMMIMQARKPLAYDFKGSFPTNRTAFLQILNGSYSYFMLLKSFD